MPTEHLATSACGWRLQPRRPAGLPPVARPTDAEPPGTLNKPNAHCGCPITPVAVIHASVPHVLWPRTTRIGTHILARAIAYVKCLRPGAPLLRSSRNNESGQ